MDIKDINKCFVRPQQSCGPQGFPENNIVPDCFNYTIPEKEDPIDYNKLNYLDYQEYDYYAKRFPPGFLSLPGFDKIILSMAEQNKNTTPLKEIVRLKCNFRPQG